MPYGKVVSLRAKINFEYNLLYDHWLLIDTPEPSRGLKVGQGLSVGASRHSSPADIDKPGIHWTRSLYSLGPANSDIDHAYRESIAKGFLSMCKGTFLSSGICCP